MDLSLIAGMLMTLVVPLMIYVATYFHFRKRDPQTSYSLLQFMLWYWLLEILQLFATVLTHISGLFLEQAARLVSAPAGLAQLVIAVLAAITIFRRWGSSPQSSGQSSSTEDLGLQVMRVLDSEDFLTALRSTLPKGNTDADHGLDYVPFMLHSVDERRRRFARRAKYFLTATTALGVVFTVIIIVFGYTLVDESVAGSARVLSELRIEARQLNDTLGILRPGYYENPVFQRDVTPALEDLLTSDFGRSNAQNVHAIRQAVDAARRTGDFQSLLPVIADVMRKASDQDSRDSSGFGVSGRNQFVRSLSLAQQRLTAFLESREGALPRLEVVAKRLNDLIPVVRTSLEKPENRVPELIKRLAVGFVVATFFIAILRYASTLYRANFQQELKAVQDDDLIRRFYVAYKGSSTPEQRTAVLTNFMGGAKTGGDGQPGAEGTSLSKEELEMFKEIVSALSKKL